MRSSMVVLLLGIASIAVGVGTSRQGSQSELLSADEMHRLLAGDPACKQTTEPRDCDAPGQNGNPPGQSKCGTAASCGMTQDNMECIRIAKYQYGVCANRDNATGFICTANAQFSRCGEQVFGDLVNGACRLSGCNLRKIPCGEQNILTSLAGCAN